MSDQLVFSVLGATDVADGLAARADLFEQIMTKRMWQIVFDVKNTVVTDHFNGPTGAHSLTRRTGALSRAVQADVEVPDAVEGSVFYTGDVPYAAIHEFGGVIHHPGGTAYFPGKDGLMEFISNAKATATMLRTKPHDITMPERAPLRTGFAEQRDYILDQLRAGVAEATAL